MNFKQSKHFRLTCHQEEIKEDNCICDTAVQVKKKKPGKNRAFIMDGLVSTGKRISLHNIKNNFFHKEKFFNKFYSHFKLTCGKGKRWLFIHATNGTSRAYKEWLSAAFLLLFWCRLFCGFVYCVASAKGSYLCFHAVRRHGRHTRRNECKPGVYYMTTTAASLL